MARKYVSDAQIAAYFGVHRTTIWRWLKSYSTFPRPVSLSPGCTRWKLEDIEAWEGAETTCLGDNGRA